MPPTWSFPAEHRTELHSRPAAERRRAIKRRTDVVGIFLNEAALFRLVGGTLFELHERTGKPSRTAATCRWKASRR